MRFPLLFVCVLGTAVAGPGVPVFFMANMGQAPRPVEYMAKGSGVTAYFLRREIRLAVAGASVRIRFEGANSAVHLEGASPQAARANFLVGDEKQWHRDVPTFGAVRYRDLYPGIDMIYGGSGAHLKSEFVVAPGADPRRIRMRYAGVRRPTVELDGSLSISLKGQRLTEAPPYMYQERNGAQTEVRGRYAPHADGTVGFSLGVYDPTLPLVIDPLLSYSTLIGTTNFNAATAIAVDSAGSAYIAGYTDSNSLPTVNPAQNFNLGGVAAFVAKLNPAGNAIEYCTYMGGSNDDRAYGIAVDSTGAAYVTGYTTSWNFPTLNAAQGSLSGSRDAFVFKLNPMGDMLVFSTFLGGSGSETANGIAVDASGASYIVGDTTSLNFPASGYQAVNRGAQDTFVAKLNASGQLVSSSYLGGGSADHGGAIAVASDRSVYVTGYTWSTDFPTAHPFQSTIGGRCNAYIARLSSNFNSLTFSTYMGGSGCNAAYPETGQGIAVDAQNNIYVAGVTSSWDFPLLNAIQPQLEGSTDAFVAKVNAAGTLLFSTYMGGSGVDVGNAIALDASGSIYVAGYTYSDDFPVTTGAAQTALAGSCDTFLFKLTPSGDTLLYATYLGGSGNDTASGVAVDPSGNVYLSGWTLSPNFPQG